MTVQLGTVRFAEAGEAVALAAFLNRLLRWDRAAAVRLQTGDGALAVFGQPAAFRVLAVRTARLAQARPAQPQPGQTQLTETRSDNLDITVSVGELLEGVEESSGSVAVPRAVTGPPWAGVLPPRRGWQRTVELPWLEVRASAAAVIAEFRERSEALPADQRVRAELDALAEEVWSRTLGETPLPLRAVHAAHALGFLRGTEESADDLALLQSGPWLRLRTPYGSIVVRRASTLGLPVTALR